MGDFRKLKVWKVVHSLTVKLYKITQELPEEEKFGLVSQLRRAAFSVESNIAEGEVRFTNNDKNNFFMISRVSVAEICTQLLVVADIYTKLNKEATILSEEYDVLGKKLTSLIKYRRAATYKPKDQLTQ